MGVLESLLAIDVAVAERDPLLAALADARRMRARLDGFEVAAARRLDELAAASPSLFPERAVAEAARVSVTEASRRFERAKTIDVVPQLAAVLDAGDTSGAHVDVVTAALRDLNPDEQQRLAARGDMLAAAAATLTRDDFARSVRREVRAACADGGMSKLQRQKRNTRLRTWTDRDTGMWCLHGQFDPETALVIDRQLQTMLDRLFHDKTPANCPTDPVAKQQHLRALALAAICAGKAGTRRTELTILLDAKTLLDGEHDQTIADLGIDLDLPVETIRRMATRADIIVPVVTAANGVNLHLGRSKRLASRDQRRLLRVMYPTCAIPGCKTPFSHTQVHHIKYFGKHHGNTDIDEEVPLCYIDHQRTHGANIELSIDEYRNLTITQPDGTTMSTGPPSRKPS